MKSTERRPIWSRPLFNLNLKAWRRLESKYGSPADRRLRTRILIQGALVSAIERFQALQYGEKIEPLRLEGPIFILGHWRSGTTLLHEILALDRQLGAPITYQCLNPHSFLLSVDGLVHRGARSFVLCETAWFRARRRRKRSSPFFAGELPRRTKASSSHRPWPGSVC